MGTRTEMAPGRQSCRKMGIFQISEGRSSSVSESPFGFGSLTYSRPIPSFRNFPVLNPREEDGTDGSSSVLDTGEPLPHPS